MSKLYVLLGAGATVAVIGATYLWGTQAGGPVPTAPAPSAAHPVSSVMHPASEADVQALQTQLATLKGEIAEVTRRLDARLVAASPASPSAPGRGTVDRGPSVEEGAPEHAAGTDDVAIAEEELRALQRVALIETQLQQESVDPQWAATAERGIRAAFAEAASGGATLANMDCRSTVCRVEVTHDSQGNFDDFRTKFTPEVAQMFPSGTMRHIDGGGGSPAMTVVYMGRAGHRLPSLPQTETGLQ